MGKKYIFYLLKVFLLVVFYVLFGRFGLTLGAVSGFATLVWVPSAISLVALIFWGYKVFPAIFLGAFLVNFLNGASLPVAAAIGIGNTLEAVLATYLLKRFQFHAKLTTHRDVIKLVILAGVVSTIVSATIGTTSLFISKTIPSNAYFSTWVMWWLGDMLSDSMIAPLLFVWIARPITRQSFVRTSEVIFLTGITLFLGIIMFHGAWGVNTRDLPLTYLVFPPLIWAAFRLNQRKTITLTFFITVLALIGTIRGFGPFVQSTLSESMLYLQSFMGITTITMLLLATVVEERKNFEKRKDDFISMASHELKTPLTSIKAFIQLAERKLVKKGDKATVQYLRKSDQQLARIVHLVDDFLDVSRIRVEDLEFKRNEFSLKELLEDVVDEMQSTVKSHRIILKGKIRQKIYGDRDRIEQVLMNLLSNAVKYSPGQKKVYIESKRDNNRIILSVKDSGIGIAPHEKKRIFELFYRGDFDISQYTGLGIGLYLSRYIVEKHGGEMWLESIKNKGSVFSFALPVGE